MVNKYLEKLAILLTMYQHEDTGNTTWISGYKPKSPGPRWIKTKKVKHVSKTKV